MDSFDRTFRKCRPASSKSSSATDCNNSVRSTRARRSDEIPRRRNIYRSIDRSILSNPGSSIPKQLLHSSPPRLDFLFFSFSKVYPSVVLKKRTLYTIVLTGWKNLWHLMSPERLSQALILTLPPLFPSFFPHPCTRTRTVRQIFSNSSSELLRRITDCQAIRVSRQTRHTLKRQRSFLSGVPLFERKFSREKIQSPRPVFLLGRLLSKHR